MNCIMQAIELFRTHTCPVSVIFVAAFLLGVVVSILAKRLSGADCGCGRKVGVRPVRRGDKPFEKRKPHLAPADGSVEIYVGNLSYDMTEDQVRAEFAAYGVVNTVRLITNKFNGRSKGFGFVNMPNRAEAERACAALNDKEIMGRRMKCNEAKNLV